VKRIGTVYIVGAGPGNPDYITVRGLTCLREADVVMHDRLIDLHLLEEARQDAEIIYAGKQAGDEDLQQEYIQSLMIEKAREGKSVCRLKGGDPFVFGRGGEEARALFEAGIPFEIVPCRHSGYSSGSRTLIHGRCRKPFA
jgi:siroheme synthase